jgi:iron(III) transport system substrate-binding protein
MKRRLGWLVAGLAVVAILTAGFALRAAAETKAEIIEKAKKEGELVLYWTIASDAAVKVVEEFNKKYPFIKVNRFQSDAFKLIGRYYQEVLARRPTCDMISITDLLPYLQFLREGNLLQYDSPEWDQLIDLPKDYTKRGYWGPIRVLPLSVMVNTNLVDPGNIKSYDDVLQDRFKGKIGAGDVETSDNAYPFYYALRKATNSTHYWKRLGELKTAVFTSSEKASEACVSGEWPVVFDIWLYRSFQYGVRKGAPVKGIIPKEGTPIIPNESAIMKQAKNPNCAKLMQDHLFSKEIQTLFTEVLGSHVARKGIPAPKGLPELKEIKVIPLDYDEAERLRKEWMGDWKKLMNR